MTLTVESKRLKLTRALRKFVADQAQRLNKVGGSVTKISVYLESISKKSNDPSANSATFTMALPGKGVMVVRKRAVDMYQAISDASKEALRHLRKAQEKRYDLQRQIKH